MAQGIRKISFPKGYEKSIRNRLGLGRRQLISIEGVLELAKVHKYNFYHWNGEHWAFKSSGYYSIYTGDGKSGWYTQNFDLGVDCNGMVTHIVESRGYPPDFGISDMVKNLFKFGTKDKALDFVVEVNPKKTVEFPKGKEKKIRQILGLADSNSFQWNEIQTLAKFHGYATENGKEDVKHTYRISPVFPEKPAIKPPLDLAVDSDEVVRSIVPII